jgi:hypothetical protein
MLVSGESPTSLESPRQETLLDRAFAGEGQRRQRRQRRRPREHGRSRLTLGYRGHVPGPGPQLQGGNMWAPLESPDRTQSALPAAAGVVAASPPTCDAVAKLSGADSRHFGTERAAGAFSDDEEGAPAQSPTWTVGAQAGGAPAGSMGPDGTGEQGRDGEAAEVQGPATLRRQELSLGERIERSHGINAGTGGRAPSPRTRAPVERHAQPRRLQRPRSGHGFRGFAAHMAAALGECAAAGAADGEGDDAAAVVGNGRSMTPPHCAQTPAAQLQLMGQNAGGATLQGRVHAVRSAPGDDGVGGGCGGGESFPRVDWVAVPEALRARRVNRAQRDAERHARGDAELALQRERAARELRGSQSAGCARGEAGRWGARGGAQLRARAHTQPRGLRGRVEIMGSQQCRAVGESQSVLMTIHPMIVFARTRTAEWLTVPRLQPRWRAASAPLGGGLPQRRPPALALALALALAPRRRRGTTTQPLSAAAAAARGRDRRRRGGAVRRAADGPGTPPRPPAPLVLARGGCGPAMRRLRG